jgi:hypothetical protein
MTYFSSEVQAMIRAYVLLDIVNGHHDRALHSLKNCAGVVLADRLEGQPDIITIVEAPNRDLLAETTMLVISSVDSITENINILVSSNKGRQTIPGACNNGMDCRQ